MGVRNRRRESRGSPQRRGRRTLLATIGCDEDKEEQYNRHVTFHLTSPVYIQTQCITGSDPNLSIVPFKGAELPTGFIYGASGFGVGAGLLRIDRKRPGNGTLVLDPGQIQNRFASGSSPLPSRARKNPSETKTLCFPSQSMGEGGHEKNPA